MALDDELPKKLSHNHPVFLNANDNLGAVLISPQLKRLENYSVWSRAKAYAEEKITVSTSSLGAMQRYSTVMDNELRLT